MNKVLIIILYFLLANGYVFLPVLNLGLTINPYNLTPLSAIYKLQATNQQELSVIVKGKTSRLSVAHTYISNYGTEFPIHGFYANYTNKLTIKMGEEILLSTNIFIGNIYQEQQKKYPQVTNPAILVHSNKNIFDPSNQDFYFLYDNYTNIVAYDGQGELRYLYKNSEKLMSRIELQNNQLYFYFVDQKIKRVNFLGQYQIEALIPAHHEFVYKNTKNSKNKIVLTVSSRGGVEDRVTEVDSSGRIVRDLLIGNVFRNVLPLEKKHVLNKTVYDSDNLLIDSITKKVRSVDWAHANSLVYDQEKDILYLSLRHLGVIAVAYEQWKLLWWLAHDELDVIIGHGYGEVPKDFVYLSEIDELKPYRMVSTIYPKVQHGLLLKKNGNLVLFDNNGDEVHNYQGSRVLEYKLDHQQRKAKIIRQYTHPRRVYSRILSDIDLIGNNNWLILWGFDTPRTDFRITRLVEVNSKNRLIMDMSLRRDWVYRVEKKPLYPYQDTNKNYNIDVLEKDFL